MKTRFLLDENLSTVIIAATKRLDSTIDILRVGSDGAPPLGTLDPDILIYCETERRMLVTDNRKTMRVHEAAHFAEGRHHWGILELGSDLSIGQLAEQLHMFWAASEAEEWIDRTEWLPY